MHRDRMSLSGAKIVVILPPREDFAPLSAGAISLVVQRFAALTPGVVVMGTPRRETFPGIEYAPVRGAMGVIAAIRRLRPEVIEVHQQPRLALALAWMFPARVLLFLHNDPLTMRGLKTRAGRWLALRRLHRVVCVSAYLQSRFMAGLRGPGPAVLPNPLTLDALPMRAVTRCKTVLFVGRITVDKAPDVFVAACAMALPQMPGWSARMIGGDRFGPDSPETAYVAGIRVAAAAAGVAFEGPRPHDAVLAAMAQAAIVVVPSRWAEPFGLTALEAFGSGAALITTGQGGLAEIAGDAAVVVPVGDVATTAAAILALCGDDAKLAALAQAGLERARLFDTKVIAARLEVLRAAPALP
jgi:UDP-glucose:(glucosyl)LPS alpha-1,2-glucosyltransferase